MNYNEMDKYRIENKTDFVTMLHSGIITKDEFNLCFDEVNKNIKSKLKASGSNDIIYF